MTPKEATKLLDMAKDGDDIDGEEIPEEVVTEALEWTDDIEAYDPPCEAVEAWVEKMRRKGVL
jgi:hypothetical protein